MTFLQNEGVGGFGRIHAGVHLCLCAIRQDFEKHGRLDARWPHT